MDWNTAFSGGGARFLANIGGKRCTVAKVPINVIVCRIILTIIR